MVTSMVTAVNLFETWHVKRDEQVGFIKHNADNDELAKMSAEFTQ